MPLGWPPIVHPQKALRGCRAGLIAPVSGPHRSPLQNPPNHWRRERLRSSVGGRSGWDNAVAGRYGGAGNPGFRKTSTRVLHGRLDICSLTGWSEGQREVLVQVKQLRRERERYR